MQFKCVRTNNWADPEIRFRFIAQDSGCGERLDELSAGTPSLVVVKLSLHQAACTAGSMGVMVLDVICPFLY